MFLFYCVFVCLCLHPLQCCLPGWILWCRYLCKYDLLVWHCMLHRRRRGFPPTPTTPPPPPVTSLFGRLTLAHGSTFSQEELGERSRFVTQPAGRHTPRPPPRLWKRLQTVPHQPAHGGSTPPEGKLNCFITGADTPTLWLESRHQKIGERERERKFFLFFWLWLFRPDCTWDVSVFFPLLKRQRNTSCCHFHVVSQAALFSRSHFNLVVPFKNKSMPFKVHFDWQICARKLKEGKGRWDQFTLYPSEEKLLVNNNGV